MKRRTFIAGLGSAAAWPLVARAQQPMPVIGYLHSGSVNVNPEQQAAFLQGLKQGGYVEGQNVAIEYRWADGDTSRLQALADDLVRRRVSVIAALGGPNSNLAAKAATKTIPIVFNTGADPIQVGLVNSINRPDGNITGVSFFSEELGSKLLDLLHELVPQIARIGHFVNPRNPETSRQLAKTEQAARTLGVELVVEKTATPDDLEKGFDALARQQAGALLIGPDAFFGNNIELIVRLAASYRLPAMFYRREHAQAGGLASYGTSVTDAYRQVGVYVARILKGAKPGDLPVMQPTKFEFVINLKTAKALGIEVPPTLSARADEIIE